MSLFSSAGLDRRTFLKTASAAGVGLVASSRPIFGAKSSVERRRYAIVGVGSRSRMFQDAIEEDYRDHAVLVGVCDQNAGRVEVSRRRSRARGANVCTGYAAGDFLKMIQETRPDVVIVTTMDSTHDDYIVQAMEAGCDVVTEKPMTTTAGKCQRILDVCARTGRHCRVLFNYRYSPPRTQVKEILMSGEIGDVLSVDFHWLLDTDHGADYFRRWHSDKVNSGGLMIHKSTHHFDLVNWWLGAVPGQVSAIGKRDFYTPQMARRLGLNSHHVRCRKCPEQKACGFFINLAENPTWKELYLDQERHDGYVRDQCVFRPDINIEDTMNVMVRYDTGATLSYSLNAFNSWEGYHVAFNGTKGRLEHSIVESTYVNGADTVQGGISEDGVTTRVIPLRGSARSVEPWSGVGGHGGGDRVMLDDLFLPSPPADKYLRLADERAGAHSVLIGVAANECFQTGGTVEVGALVTGLGHPVYAPMPSPTAPLPMPEKTARLS